MKMLLPLAVILTAAGIASAQCRSLNAGYATGYSAGGGRAACATAASVQTVSYEIPVAAPTVCVAAVQAPVYQSASLYAAPSYGYAQQSFGYGGGYAQRSFGYQQQNVVYRQNFVRQQVVVRDVAAVNNSRNFQIGLVNSAPAGGFGDSRNVQLGVFNRAPAAGFGNSRNFQLGLFNR